MPLASSSDELGLDDAPALLDQVRVERGVLAGGRGDVPAVDDHVDDAMARGRSRRAPARRRRHTARSWRRAPRRPPGPRRPIGRRRPAGRHRARRRRSGRRPRRWCGPRAGERPRSCPATTWLTRARRSQSAHGVVASHWSAPTPATKRRVSASARAWTSGSSVVMASPSTSRHGGPVPRVQPDGRGLSTSSSPFPQASRGRDELPTYWSVGYAFVSRRPPRSQKAR